MKEVIQQFRAKGLSPEDIDKILDLAGNDPAKFKRYAQRRLFGEPFAYLAGEVTFFGRKFKVGRRVYVPNPETEQMVKLLLTEIKPDDSVVDVGTGSGVIAITIKKECPTVRVYGVDIDPSALEVARWNSRLHRAHVDFQESFYVDDLDINSPGYIISDMPYGNPSYVLGSIDIKEFEHIPPISLFHPFGILEAYKELIDSIEKKGWKSQLFFETGLVDKSEVTKIIPKGLNWEYKRMNNYSITVVQF